MNRLLVILFTLSSLTCLGQETKNNSEEILINKILADPSPREIKKVLSGLRKQNLSPRNVTIHDSIALSNANTLYILSHVVEGNKHYGAVIIPDHSKMKKMPVLILATGGDGMHTQFDITQDFNHSAAQFPNLIGSDLDNEFIIVIPSFRGQQMIIGDKKYQSEGNVGDAFHGATTDAIAFLNVTLATFNQADKERIAIYGGSRGGTVALLASSRDKRIKRTIVVAAPTDMKALYLLYPDQFKLLFFNDLLQGKITEDEARKKFISSSPIYFIKELPVVQLHHDKNDPFVPVEFARRLTDNMSAIGKDIDNYFYDEGIHGFWNDEVFWKRVQHFIRPLIE
ncbi:prolyl oligopeptidase family serine peptidase [Fulvivirgaceae bacterium BMA10]|uniref:Prolyl oligopeptidase family serine peptidase n=1 Tax=Splendidivirga corallicola TaxID=3051826 RepID=A0ABT8KPW8_9BACT|nr:prolyl oligopeptidase family serine peptidase [Fulvivirgaceae bacterium BMA10]